MRGREIPQQQAEAVAQGILRLVRENGEAVGGLSITRNSRTPAEIRHEDARSHWFRAFAFGRSTPDCSLLTQTVQRLVEDAREAGDAHTRHTRFAQGDYARIGGRPAGHDIVNQQYVCTA